MADDIVTRLRLFNYPLEREAADEIERLREMCDVFRAIAEQRTSERDEARREVCAMSFDDQRRTADERGWDCFKEPVHAP